MKTPYKVLLTNHILASEHARLAQYAEVIVAPDIRPDTLRKLVADADALIVRTKLPDDIFDHQTRLKGVVRHGVGLDMIPMAEAARHRIPVANIPGSNTASVVEYCVNAMFHFARNLESLVLDKPGRNWAETRVRADATEELHGKTLGIVGVGAIGSSLATVGAALGMRVLGLSRRPERLPAHVTAAAKKDLFEQSDFVVLACPLTDQTRGLVDVETLSVMKQKAILINVSRGPVVDTQALISALLARKLGGAILDVHDTQPIPEGLYPEGLEGLLLTPHVAGTTQTSMERMSAGSVDEVLRILRGERFVNLVNPEVLA